MAFLRRATVPTAHQEFNTRKWKSIEATKNQERGRERERRRRRRRKVEGVARFFLPVLPSARTEYKCLVAEANAQDFLFHGVEGLEEEAKFEDPMVVPICIVRTTANHKAVIAVELFVLREVSFDHPIQIPSLPRLAECRHKNIEVSSVHFLRILRVLGCQQKRILLFSSFVHRRTMESEKGEEDRG
ncbi:hypothetical protein Nepgr_015628 [Nepenthes gracilis]|uniref:Uncharacterized protein n=1 Tax=Nepenthes gracilis TaxID=150966 RepID=A0AAD3SNL2_NEPGR|nr:hypothetical protein Nepgr_015628 [Nepenthes gracilis]